MQQVALLPAGCQTISRQCLYANEDVIYYASTLSIYVFSAKSFVLERVVSITATEITGSILVPSLYGVSPCLISRFTHWPCYMCTYMRLKGLPSVVTITRRLQFVRPMANSQVSAGGVCVRLLPNSGPKSREDVSF
jgi:hypothetical protein